MPSTSTSPSSEPERWLHITLEAFVNCITFWKPTSSLKTLMESCKRCGSRRTTKRQRSCAVVPSDPLINTGSARSSPCHGPSGMANRRRTVSRNELAACWGSGTYRILTPIPARKGNWHKPLDWLPLKWAIGLKIGGRETGRQLPKTGQFNGFDWNRGISRKLN